MYEHRPLVKILPLIYRKRNATRFIMTTYKPVKDYTIEEVIVWVESIGLDSGPFKDNAVDGDMLCHLTTEELSEDLGLSGLQGAFAIVQFQVFDAYRYCPSPRLTRLVSMKSQEIPRQVEIHP